MEEEEEEEEEEEGGERTNELPNREKKSTYLLCLSNVSDEVLMTPLHDVGIDEVEDQQHKRSKGQLLLDGSVYEMAQKQSQVVWRSVV